MRKTLLLFVVLIQFLSSLAQDCELVETVLKFHEKDFDYYILCNELAKSECKKSNYFYRNSNPYIKEKLVLHFSEYLVDSLINLLETGRPDSSFPERWKDCRRNEIKIISTKKADKIYKYNNTSEKFRRKTSKNPRYTYTVFHVSLPVYYKNYAFIQCLQVVKSLNAVYGLHLLKYVNGKWEHTVVLYGWAS